MDFNLNEEQQMLRDAANRYVREQYDFESRRKLAAGAGWSPEHWAQFAEMGWLALSVPQDAGGLGCSFIETALVAEELGRALALEPLVGVAVLGARLLDQARHPLFLGQRELLLGGIADGSARVALAYIEPSSRFDFADPQTSARPERDEWVLNGIKMMVGAAPCATHFIVTAQVQNGGVGLFLVQREAVQVLEDYALIDGSRAADIALRDVRVGADALLLDPAQGCAVLEEALDRAALAHVAEGLGCMEAVLELTSDYIKTRQQFGQPIGKFQALQHRMAEMFVEVQETRSILLRGIAHIDADPLARRIAVSAAKAMLGSAGRFVGGQGIQLHGGIGVTDEYPVGHYYKRLLVLDKLYGDADWHLDRFVETQRAQERVAA
jgi:alkylation response protein AidB-like acyl-CoA dehydrogenase